MKGERGISFRDAYRSYRGLIVRLKSAGASEFAAESLADGVLQAASEQTLWMRAQYHGLLEAFRAAQPLWQPLRDIRDSIRGGRGDDEPLPDVYAAALSMRKGGDWKVEKPVSIYRGQRCSEWRVIPSLFRPARDRTVSDIGTRWAKTRAFMALLRSHLPELSEEQCLAVAQHYSADDEAGTPTQLIDVTWEPLVALFFASLHGVSGDLGVVDHIVVPEWRRLIATESGDPGAIRTIAVPAVERIDRQRALFLHMPDPDLYERYGPYRIYFRQVRGLVFEDPDTDPPITVAEAFPVDQKIRSVIELFRRSPSHVTAVAPGKPPKTEVLDGMTLYRRALAMNADMAHLDAYHESVLRVVGEVLAQGPSWARDDPAKYAIHRLAECVDMVAMTRKAGGCCSVERALQFTLTRLNEEQKSRVLEIAHATWVQVHCVAPELIRTELLKLIDSVYPIPGTKVAGLAFCSDRNGTDKTLSALATDSLWTVLDMRGLTDEAVTDTLMSNRRPGVFLATVDQVQSLPTPVWLMIKAIVDQRQSVQFPHHRSMQLPPEAMWVLICGGRRVFERDRRRVVDTVPYWMDVDEF